MRFGSFIIFILTMICSMQAFAGNAKCGTMQAAQHFRTLRDKTPWQNPEQARFVIKEAACGASDFYDSVYTQKTEHFQIFYTIDGPHRTTEAFIDTLAKKLEFAWDFYTKDMKMLAPYGLDSTLHYLKKVDDNLYPVEVIDIDLLRNTRIYLNGVCHGCFGVTLGSGNGDKKSELVIENDFLFTPMSNTTRDTVKYHGKTCSYTAADQELVNTEHDYSYADQWEHGIEVTTLHELYHAVQQRYLDMYEHWTFWFEASASGMEETAYPQIDDYFSYLPSLFSHPGTSLDSFSANENYGFGIFLLYLQRFVSKDVDRFIWENFANNPNGTFQTQFEKMARDKKLKAEVLFHDFSRRLAFSGTRANLLDSADWIANDQDRWPTFKIEPVPEPSLNRFSYNFSKSNRLDLQELNGHASLALINKNASKIIPITSTNKADSILIELEDHPADSLIWILSHFENDKPIPTHMADSTFRAYPVPWRQGHLCFTALPKNKKFIELRNRRGDLVTRIDYTRNTQCIDENQVKNLMVPGVYRYRAGNKGKTKSLIIVY